MSAPTGPPARPAGPRSAWVGLPTRPIGWLAVAAAVVGLGSWIVLPIITTVFRETYPVTDTFVMPLIGAVLIVIAAVLNPLAIWVWKQKNALNLIAMLLTVGAALFLLPFVIGEGISGT